jgi:phosphotransacetylase
MQSELSKKYITVDCKNGNRNLNVDEYARWLCLLEALDIISRKAQQFKVDLHGKDVDWVKPLAFQKYIVDRYESMKDEVVKNETVVETFENNTTCTTSSEPALV